MNDSKSQFFSTREETIKWLDGSYIKNYIINDDLSVNVSDNVSIDRLNLKIIPVKFNNVTGNFWCHNNKLTSLTGSPKSVGGHFCCNNNKLINLNSSPEIIGGTFYCTGNQLISLLEIEIINCDFKEIIYFNIDINNFKQKGLIQVLKKYYNSKYEHYELTNCQLHDIIKPQIEKENLDQKLIKSENKLKSKNNFI